MEQKRIAWHKSPIEKETLSGLMKRSDAAGLRQAGGFLLIYLGSTALALFFFKAQMWIPMVLVCYLHAVFLSFMGMSAAVHELSHTTPFKTRWLNEFFYYLFSFLTWTNPVHFRYSHQKHHHFTVYRGVDKEVVLEPVAESPFPMRLSTLLRCLTFDYKRFSMMMKTNLLHLLGKGDADFFYWDPLFAPDDKHRRQMIAWARFMMAAHLILLALFVYFHLWVLIFTVTFGSFFATFLAIGCTALQHLGLRPNVPDWRLCCHTLHMNPLMRFLYWQMNYHIEHHMYAGVPFYNLPKLHEAIQGDLPRPMARGLIGGLKQLVSIQKKQQAQPGYCYEPEFPETALPPKYTE